MAGCTCENWTLEDLSSALRDMHKDNKKIVVPMFQRGKRWKKGQEQKFIDSLIKGYPVGTMLFYETYEDNKRTYILVDGLQRGNSIKKYMTNPTEFFYDDNISYETQAEFEIGLDVHSHRITIPIRDEFGRLVGIKGRRVWDVVDEYNPKYIYLHNCEKSKILYGLYKFICIYG